MPDDVFCRELLKKRGVEKVFVKRYRAAIRIVHAPYMDHLLAGKKPEDACDFIAWIFDFKHAQNGSDGEIGRLVVRAHSYVARENARRIRIKTGNEGAAPLVADKNALIGKDLERTPHGALTYLKALRELGFIGEHVPRLPDARFNHLTDFAAHQLKKRFPSRKDCFKYFGVLHGIRPQGIFC